MTVEILYCTVWAGYDRRAASLAAEINSTTGVPAHPVGGGKGQFDVVADGRLVFSKQAEGRFPEPAEVLALLQP